MKKSTNYFARAAMMLLLALLGSTGAWAQDDLKIIVGATTGTATVIGDINNDGAVNGEDVQEIVKFIMQDPQATTDMSKVDINCDKLVNAADIVALTNIINSDTEIVYVSGEGETFAFQVETSKAYNVSTATAWITIDPEAKDGQHYVTVAMNPSTEQRMGIVTVTSADGSLGNSLTVVQAGKEDSRYIDIDWEKDHLDSFDAETGETKITFADAVPIMGEYDVVLLPTEGGGLAIRVINEVAKTEGKTVTLKTEKGDMGNLFRDEKFTLDFDMTGNESTSAKARAAAADGGIPVYYPVSVEEFDGEKFVEIYNAEKPKNRATRAPNDDDNWYELSATGTELYKDANVHLKWKHHLMRFNLRGKTTLEFKKSPWWKVWKGETVEHSLTSEGTIYNEMELECHNFVCEDHKYSWDKRLNDVAIWRDFNFKIGEKKIPLRMRMFCDIDCEYSFRSNGIVDMTAGVTALSTVKYGYIYKEDNHDEPGSNFECKTVYDNLTEPSLQVADINADQYMEVEASCYPYYHYIFYDGEREFQLQPKQVINVGGYGRKVDNKYSAMNLEATTENKAFLWLEVNKDKYKIDKSVPGTKKIFSMPASVKPSGNNYDVQDVIEGDVRELEFKVFDRDWIRDDNPSKGAMLVKLTCKNGLFVDMNNADGSSANNAVETYQYIDKNGCVKCKIKQISEEKPGKVIAELIGGNPNMEPIVGDFSLNLHKYEIQCLTPEVEIEKGQTATIQYQINHYWNGELINHHIMPHVEFIAEGGTVSPLEITENVVEGAEGKLTVTFTPDENATEGKVGAQPTLEYKQMKWLGASIAHITIKGGGGSTPCDTGDELLNKANLMDNSYVIKNKKTGEEQVRNYDPTWSEWRKEGKDFISFSLEDADANGMTLGMAWGHIPLTMSGVVLALTGQTFENTPGGKFGLDVYEGTEISADFACFTGESGMTTMGNIKPESKIMLREPCNKKAGTRGDGYSGEYEILFYLVFQNQTWNKETQQMELGDEYEVYGKGTMKMHIPTITSMNLSSEAQYLKVGESTKVNVDGYYEDGAQWDWNDVQISGQSADYSDAYDGVNDGYFTWDATTQTLTSVKPNDNKSVYVIFSLKSRPSCQSAMTIATGEGWKYTSFKVGPEEQEVGSGYCSYYVEDWAPRDSEEEKFDDSAIEIDPASDPEGNFKYVQYYGQYSARLYVYRSDAAPGEYNIRFRLKSNHDIGCTMKIIIKPEE